MSEILISVSGIQEIPPGEPGEGTRVTVELYGNEYTWEEWTSDQTQCCGESSWGHAHGCEGIYGEDYIGRITALKGWPTITRGDLGPVGNRRRYAEWLHQHRSSNTCGFCQEQFCPYDGDEGYCWDCWEQHADSVSTPSGAHDGRREDGTGAAGGERDYEWATEQGAADHDEGEDEWDY